MDRYSVLEFRGDMGMDRGKGIREGIGKLGVERGEVLMVDG